MSRLPVQPTRLTLCLITLFVGLAAMLAAGPYLAGARTELIPNESIRLAPADERLAWLAGPGPRVLVSELDGAVSRIWSVPAGAPADDPRLLAEVEHRHGFGLAAAVAPAGPRLALVHLPPDRATARVGGLLQVVDLASGERRAIGGGADPRVPPQWSPDGRYLLFDRLVAEDADLLTTEVLVASVDPPFDLVRIATESERTAIIGAAGWTSDGAVLYTRLTGDGTELWQADSGTWETRRLAPLTPGIAAVPGLAPDRQRLAFVDRRRTAGGFDEGVSVWHLAEDRLERIRTDGGDPFWFAWHGARLVTGSRSDPMHVWPAGPAPQVLARPLQTATGERWIDGAFPDAAVAVARQPDGLLLVGPDGSERPIRLSGYLTPIGTLAGERQP